MDAATLDPPAPVADDVVRKASALLTTCELPWNN
jgi:hypothetical protein